MVIDELGGFIHIGHDNSYWIRANWWMRSISGKIREKHFGFCGVGKTTN